MSEHELKQLASWRFDLISKDLTRSLLLLGVLTPRRYTMEMIAVLDTTCDKSKSLSFMNTFDSYHVNKCWLFGGTVTSRERAQTRCEGQMQTQSQASQCSILHACNMCKLHDGKDSNSSLMIDPD